MLNIIIAPYQHELDLFLRLFLGALLGWLIGLERETLGKTAGTRTFALVSLGSALFSIVSSEGFLGETGVISTSVASSIVIGIGFLGAGLIILREGRVENLTTASALWVTAAIGLSLGRGLFSLAIFTFLLTLFLLFSFRWIHPGRWRAQKEQK